MTLVEFLFARLADDEAVASAVQAELGSEREGEPYEDGSGIAWKDSFPSYPWGVGDIELTFMATAGHPARALAEVDAKRRIIELAAEAARIEAKAWGEFVGGERDETVNPGIDTEILRAMAAPHADHPDFDPNWKPEDDT